ncbi:hypothetical protein T4B_11139 [Trichinella pseudospiralis]|uniref:Uncharacterized protein n=1 Tax=Trichinella pseudospiralis TaxID=6337 RepID=A0A0V1IUN3_TRIPS|nr:hypothetical protein T4B_11139 [Trichinella pseudospiralis]KRZ39939.1 hypothetical protein T4C_6343 [Trichinella pseudospiralis]
MDMHFHSTAFGKHVMIDPKSLRLSAHRSTDEHDSCSSWCFVEQRNKSRLLGERDNKGDNKERMEGKVTSGGSKRYEKYKLLLEYLRVEMSGEADKNNIFNEQNRNYQTISQVCHNSNLYYREYNRECGRASLVLSIRCWNCHCENYQEQAFSL